MGSTHILRRGADGITATDAEINQLDATTLTAGVTVTGSLVKLTETIAYTAMTDVTTTLTYDITAGTIPVGAWYICSQCTALTGFAGDTSAVITIGDGTDADRYNTGTPDVFTTAANGVALGAPSGVQSHDAAKTIKVTITTAADATSVSAGSITLEFYYLT